MKSFFGSALAAVYFIVAMCPVILLMLFMPFGFMMDVDSVRSSGFAGPNAAASLIGLCGLAIGLSLLIPPLRKMYRLLPWLYPLVQIMFVNLVILSIGLLILDYGYEVNNESRHTRFYLLMIAHVVLCRFAICVYYKIKPVNFGEEGAVRG